MTQELPDPWGAELSNRGIRSYRDMEAATGVGKDTARRLVRGGRTSADTVKKVADALFGGDRNKIWELRGDSVRDHGDWQLPAEASLLTERQREAVRAVIIAMTPSLATAEPAPSRRGRSTKARRPAETPAEEAERLGRERQVPHDEEEPATADPEKSA